MKYNLLIIVLFIWSGCFSQKTMPMKDCSYYFNIDSLSVRPYYSPNYSLMINSKQAEVVSLTRGIISKIINHNDTLSVIIRSGDLFYIYSDISVLSKKIKSNKSIAKRDIIGKGIQLKDSYGSQLQIYKGTNVVSNTNKYVTCDFIKK